jgi:hypothetical protein
MSDGEDPIGKVSDFFWKREVVQIEVLDGTIEEGDTLHVTGEYTDETIDVEDMEIDDEPVGAASEGDVFAMPLGMQQRVMIGDQVYRAN